MKEFKSVLILGRQPGLSLAELENRLGTENIQPFGDNCLSSINAEDIPFSQLGGTVKTARLLAELPSSDWQKIVGYILREVPAHTSRLPEGKFTFGISVYGIKVGPQQINKASMSLKKLIKATGRSVRSVPNKEPALNTAQVLHNKLTHRGAWELIIVSNGKKSYLAQSLFVQDIEAYAARDQARPKRDSKIGMLPPKLAQIIINLAVGKISHTKKEIAIYDPFCGTGVILQEALLMGYNVLGSDVNANMVEYTKDNLHWLVAKSGGFESNFSVELNDATKGLVKKPFDYIASEIDLGPILKGRSSSESINQAVSIINPLLELFIGNASNQNVQKMCLAVPCWELNGSFTHLPLLDRLSDLGYNRLSFVHAGAEGLIYHRPGQAVGREIIVLKKF